MANKIQHTSATPREFTLELLKQITDNFSEEHVIGRGGCGVVYKGLLHDGEEIALKKLHYIPGLDDKQFMNEFNNLMRAQHPNIIRLVGYCSGGHERFKHNGEYIFARVQERILCFEYLQGGSLDKHISDESCGLDWNTRFKIIKGVSKGINYLHNGCKDPIYHLDLKPENILLDKNLVPKIGDFGLSRLFQTKKTHITSTFMGTMGYMPPEYIKRLAITPKFDVFSFGVIIIRIVAGYEGYSKCEHMSPREFLEHVHGNWGKRMQETLSSHISEQVMACIKIAFRCVELDREKRPTIADIVNELDKIDSAESLAIAKSSDEQEHTQPVIQEQEKYSTEEDTRYARTDLVSPFMMLTELTRGKDNSIADLIKLAELIQECVQSALLVISEIQEQEKYSTKEGSRYVRRHSMNIFSRDMLDRCFTKSVQCHATLSVFATVSGSDWPVLAKSVAAELPQGQLSVKELCDMVDSGDSFLLRSTFPKLQRPRKDSYLVRLPRTSPKLQRPRKDSYLVRLPRTSPKLPSQIKQPLRKNSSEKKKGKGRKKSAR